MHCPAAVGCATSRIPAKWPRYSWPRAVSYVLGRSENVDRRPMAKMKALIAGGGIGGITSVLALRARGIECQLFEQAPAFGQVGAGLQVSSNAARVLLKLGLGAVLKTVATYPEGRDYRGWDDGERLYYTPLGQRAEAYFGAPYYAAHRADLLDVLLSGLGQHGFRLGSRIERVDQDKSGVTVTLADGSSESGDLL